jgi:hypothetical protein
MVFHCGGLAAAVKNVFFMPEAGCGDFPALPRKKPNFGKGTAQVLK